MCSHIWMVAPHSRRRTHRCVYSGFFSLSIFFTRITVSPCVSPYCSQSREYLGNDYYVLQRRAASSAVPAVRRTTVGPKRRKTFQPPSAGLITNTLSQMFTPQQGTYELTDNAFGTNPTTSQPHHACALLLLLMTGCLLRCGAESIVRKLHQESRAVPVDDAVIATEYKPQIVVQFDKEERIARVFDNGAGGNQRQLEEWARPGASHNAASRETTQWYERLGFFKAHFSQYGAGSKAGGASMTNGNGELRVRDRPERLARYRHLSSRLLTHDPRSSSWAAPER